MKIDKPFNQLQKEEYLYFIENHKQYIDFNTLGLYRSLLENEQLSTEDKTEIRDFAHQYFQKTFDFLQLKDPLTYLKVVHLETELTQQEELAFWDIIRQNQEKILKDKKIKHRNFGVYAKHNCGYDYCPYNGLMIKQGSNLAESCMFFKSDRNRDEKKNKVKRLAKEQRDFKNKRI